MTTVAKVAIGAAVVGAGYLLYKSVGSGSSAVVPRPTSAPGVSSAGVVNGFLQLGTSIFGYFGKSSPQPQAVPASAYQGSPGSEAYAYEANGVLPKDATSADYDNGNVVFGPFLS